MQVQRITTIGDFERLTDQWNCLARGVPFRCWQWLLSWWRHFCDEGELCVLTVRDASGTLVGVAPWYLANCAGRGRVLRLLGSGRVYSDYMSLLTTSEHEKDVVGSIAQWLNSTTNSTGADRWDLLELTGVDAGDRVTSSLAARLEQEGCTVHCRAGLDCWRIDLPSSWDELLTTMSKSHRKQIRRTERRLLDSGRATLRTASSHAEVDEGMNILVDLHNRRRQSLNEPGCFTCQRFTNFLRDSAATFLDAEMLRLHWVQLDGKPVAVEFQLASGDVTYAYQAGVEPDSLDQEPGRLINIATLKRAIDEGQRGFDFLRGDEAYKAHWRAKSKPSVEYRISASRTVSQLRHRVWLAGSSVKRLFKRQFTWIGLS